MADPNDFLANMLGPSLAPYLGGGAAGDTGSSISPDMGGSAAEAAIPGGAFPPGQPSPGPPPWQQMAQQFMGPRPDTTQATPADFPTPWYVKALGGLQDALALISKAKHGAKKYYTVFQDGVPVRKVFAGYDPNESKAEFGGLATALLASRNQANAANILKRRKAEEYDANMKKLGQAIAFHTGAKSKAGAPKDAPDPVIVRLKNQGW